MFHLHYSSHSRDCDGSFEFYSDYRPDRDDIDWDSPLDIATTFVMGMLFHYPEHGPVNIEIAYDHDGHLVFSSHRGTDEGYAASVYVICDCDDYTPGSRQRDVYAERAGY